MRLWLCSVWILEPALRRQLFDRGPNDLRAGRAIYRRRSGGARLRGRGHRAWDGRLGPAAGPRRPERLGTAGGDALQQAELVVPDDGGPAGTGSEGTAGSGTVESGISAHGLRWGR